MSCLKPTVNHADTVHDANTVLFVSLGCFITPEDLDDDVAKPSWNDISRVRLSEVLYLSLSVDTEMLGGCH